MCTSKLPDLSVYTNIHLLQFPFWKSLYINFTISQTLYLNEISCTVKDIFVVYLCYYYSTRIVILRSAVIFNVANLLSYAGRNLAYKLSFAFTSFFFCFATFSSNFLLIYLNKSKISLMLRLWEKKKVFLLI